MKRKINILKITTIFTAFALGIASLTGVFNKIPTKVEATQNLSNYDLYSYDGDYYSSKNIDFNATGGLDGNLRKSLTNNIRPAAFTTYSGYAVGDNLSTHLQKADEDPTNSSNMVYFYSRNSVTKTAANADANTVIWNREHVWPKSLSSGNWEGDTKGKQKAGTDILHLRPEYASVNSSRGNDKFGDNNKAGEKQYQGMTYGYSPSGSSYFEPVDAVKGDVARIIMYVWTTYTDYDGYEPIDILDVFESYDTLIKWHTMDKPDVLEGNRNDYAQSSKQLNRNPFVDHPELAWKIFGTEVDDSTILNNCVSAYPASGYVPVNPTTITLNETSLSMDVDDTFSLTATLSPDGAVGSVSWSSNNTSVATVSENGVVTAKGAGSATITASVSSSIYATCSVTVIPSGFMETLEIASSIAVGDVVYLTCNDVNMQYAGPSSTSTIYGLGQEFTNKPDKTVFALEVENGSSSGTYSFKLKGQSKYLCWATGNSLKTDTNKNASTSWNISFDGNNNATITNATDSTRAIWWNKTYPRFACYSGASAGNAYKNVQLWKIVSSAPTGPDAYLSSATAIKTIRGSATPAQQNKTNTITFASLGLNNGEQYLDPFDGTNFTVTFSGGGNDGKYYDTGTGIRTYGGGSITIAAKNGNLTSIIFTWASGSDYKPSSANVVNVGTYNTNNYTWSGSASSVTITRPSGTGHWRLQAVQATCLINSYNFDLLDVRFGVKIATSAWDTIVDNPDWIIQDYGVMMYLTTENKLSTAPTVASRYNKNLDLDSQTLVSVGRRESGAAPATDGNGNYNFTVKVNIPSSSWYDYYFIVRPFVQINDEICWLLGEDIQESVRTLAVSNSGTNLEPDVLSYLAGN